MTTTPDTRMALHVEYTDHPVEMYTEASHFFKRWADALGKPTPIEILPGKLLPPRYTQLQHSLAQTVGVALRDRLIQIEQQVDALIENNTIAEVSVNYLRDGLKYRTALDELDNKYLTGYMDDPYGSDHFTVITPEGACLQVYFSHDATPPVCAAVYYGDRATSVQMLEFLNGCSVRVGEMSVDTPHWQDMIIGRDNNDPTEWL